MTANTADAMITAGPPATGPGEGAGPCPDCAVVVGAEHAEGCDWATCLATGEQRLSCELDTVAADHDCGRDVWLGEDHASRAAIEYGFWCVVPEYGGPRPARADAPGAIPDGNRVLIECEWDPGRQRWVRLQPSPARGVHTAQPPPGPSPEAKASERARARENTPHSAPAAPYEPSNTTALILDRIRSVARAIKALGSIGGEWCTVPDLKSRLRTMMRARWAYASHAPWTTPTGLLRRLGQAYAAVVAIPFGVATICLDWTVERPSRLTAAVIFYVFARQFPPLSWLLN